MLYLITAIATATIAFALCMWLLWTDNARPQLLRNIKSFFNHKK